MTHSTTTYSTNAIKSIEKKSRAFPSPLAGGGARRADKGCEQLHAPSKYSQQLDFGRGKNQNEHRSIQIVHEDANEIFNKVQNSSAPSKYSQQLDFGRGKNQNEHRSVQIVHEDANEIFNKVQNSSAPSIFDITHMGSLYIHGKDALNFLQGQLTCDMTLLTASNAQPAACCNLQGRIVALFFVMPWEAGYLLMLPKSILDTTQKHLKKYAIFSKVFFDDNSHHVFLGFSQNPPMKLLSKPPTFYACLNNLFIAVFPPEEALQYLAAAKEKYILLDAAAWHKQQIMQGFPDIYPTTQSVFLPHRIGLQNIEGVLNFKKGCYLGQEIIARTHFKATLKHAVYVCEASCELTINPGDTLFNKTHENNIGEIIDVSVTPDNQQVFLAAIKTDSLSDLPESIKIKSSH